ncbi:MAG: ADP-forming succinate--CoA ligase subunit beta [Euryarchaeota archaeon]|nr:ADP-forming succinate--CoA ligase subunit beta [Euryarchaeota archaeon]MBU4453665.1 ADP-forming succinate--CoA ligase subunit beta [Euryarchaeota archaeon]
MMLHEHAAKDIFSKYGIPVPQSSLIVDAEDAKDCAMRLGKVVLKAQVATGGRGKAGGILTVATPQEAVQNARRILGMPIKGLRVKKLLVEEFVKPEKEMYLGITIDRKERCPIIMASSEGGMDIEEVARTSPEKILRMHIDPLTGVHDYQARAISQFLDKGNTALVDIIMKLYQVFTDNDCTLAEINPLALTERGVLALDAKMNIDENALFRQKFEEEEEDTPSATAKKNGMSYVALDGDIGCIVNGAGLAMALLDMIKHYGGEAANFMDVRAGANEEQMKIAMHLVSSNTNVKAIIVNIFGGITKCDEVARGIIDSGVKLPVVIRLTGTNEEDGKRMLEEHGMILASTSEEAAREAVALGHSHR